MMQRKKRFNIDNFLVIAVAVAFFGIMVAIVVSTLSHYKKSHSPLYWCICEIQHTEYFVDDDGDPIELFYTYTVPEYPPEVEQEEPTVKSGTIYKYIITTYNDEFSLDWFCLIECYHKDLFDKMVGSKLYFADEIVAIDCDEIPGTLTYYEEELL